MTNKIQIYDPADPTVGLFPTSWEIEVPFLIEKDAEKRKEQKDDIEFFREAIKDAYGAFCDGKPQVTYDFEHEEMEAKYAEYEGREVRSKYDEEDGDCSLSTLFKNAEENNEE